MRRGARNRVFLPWERRKGLFGGLGRARVSAVLGVLVLLAAVVFVYRHEEDKAAMRATRAAITVATRAVDTYRADHGGACPRGLEDVVAARYAREVPVDAWGRPLRLTCPGRRDPRGFDVASDGADGIAGGLDRVE